MSDAIRCDNSGTVLALDRHGEDENGEVSAWLRVGTCDRKLAQDACTRACAIELLADGTPLADAIDAHMEGIAAVVRAIRGEDDEGQRSD